MVVDGALGLLFKHAIGWSRPAELAPGRLVLDMTHSLYWLTRRLVLRDNRMDLYGCSMVEYGAFVRRLIQSLVEREVQPIVVYEGGRLSERQHGPLVSKAHLMAQGCRRALDNLNSCRTSARAAFHSHLPELAANALKEIVNEFQLEFVIQSQHEVYPVLEHLARKHHCPVMTSHADFIFYDVPEGFVWLNVIQLPASIREPFACRIFEHQKMMHYYNLLLPDDCGALRSLFVLLRADFRERYFRQINRLLKLRGEMALSEQLRDRRLTSRLEQVLDYWVENGQLMTIGTIRSTLSDQNPTNDELRRDFDLIYESFASYEGDFEASQYATMFPGCDLNEALTSREAGAELLLNLHSTQNSRTPIEDTHLFRSTYSLHDNCRQQLLASLRLESLQIFDRSLGQLQQRSLLAARRNGDELQLDRDSLFRLFHFDSRQLRLVARELIALGLDPKNSGRLALVLLLAHFGLKLMDRRHHGNEEQDSRRANVVEQHSASDSDDSGLANSQLNELPGEPQRRVLQFERRRLLTAIANSHIYHTDQVHRNKSNKMGDIRVAQAKASQVTRQPPKIQPGNERFQHEYFRLKHTVEMVNSVLHGYIELNSLYAYPGPRLYVCRHYDAVLIYKIMSRWSSKLQSYLIKLRGRELDRLISGPDLRTQHGSR